MKLFKSLKQSILSKNLFRKAQICDELDNQQPPRIRSDYGEEDSHMFFAYYIGNGILSVSSNQGDSASSCIDKIIEAVVSH
jgi:hypothetical protein